MLQAFFFFLYMYLYFRAIFYLIENSYITSDGVQKQSEAAAMKLPLCVKLSGLCGVKLEEQCVQSSSACQHKDKELPPSKQSWS